MTTRAATGSSTLKPTTAATEQAVRDALGELKGSPPVMGLVFASPHHNLREVMAVTSKLCPGMQVAVTHGSGEITQRGFQRDGLAVMLVASDTLMAQAQWANNFSRDLDGTSKNLCAAYTELAPKAKAKGAHHSSSLLLLDGLTGDSEGLLNNMLAGTRPYQQLAGMRASDEGQFKQTMTGANGIVGPGGAAAMHLFDDKQMAMGVAHGWKAVTPPFRITKNDRNTVYEIDGKPAFETYKAFAKTKGVTLDSKNAQAFFVRYMLGTSVLGEVHNIRAGIGLLPNGAIICSSGVEPNSLSVIVDGETSELVRASEQAAQEAKKNLQGKKAAAVIHFSCFARRAFMGDLHREAEVVASTFPGVPVIGTVSYAELARYAGKLNGVHGGTAVIAAIPA